MVIFGVENMVFDTAHKELSFTHNFPRLNISGPHAVSSDILCSYVT